MLKPAPLRALTDTRFELWLTPRLVRWLYLACVVTLGATGAFGSLFWWWLAARLGGMFAVMMPVSIVGALTGILGVRVLLEVALARFKPPAPPAPRVPPEVPAPPLRPNPGRPSPPPMRKPSAPRMPAPSAPDQLTRPDMGWPSLPPVRKPAAPQKRVWP